MMGFRMMRAALAATALAAAGMAGAQERSENQVGANSDWRVYVESNPTECWAMSQPKKTVNTRGGKAVNVRRGDIVLFVFYRPGAKVQGQVTFTGGYPFAKDSTVNLNIGGTQFELYTDGEWAWPASAGDDAKVVAAMKSGADAVLTARSSRGTQTQDTFSLFGFTASVEDAAKRCSK